MCWSEGRIIYRYIYGRATSAEIKPNNYRNSLACLFHFIYFAAFFSAQSYTEKDFDDDDDARQII